MPGRLSRVRGPRRALAVGLVAAALLAPTVPVVASPRTPSGEDLRRAQQSVTAARRLVADLQARAEHAAEEYNGALVRAQHARTAQAAATARAAVAETAYQGAQDSAAIAQATALGARVQADAARAAQREADRQAAAAQRKLDRVAVGAYQTDGQLGMVSQLFLASDPLELATGRILMNRVGIYQNTVIREAAAARAAASAARTQAEQAEQTAVAAAAQATAALDRAATARAHAAGLQRAAARAALDAIVAANDASRARRTALALVAQAQARLTAAVLNASDLKKQAAAARREAAGYQNIDAPSDAARIAIHWAFQEIGVPYAWGGGDDNGPTEGFAQGAGTVGFDCSGLTMFAYHKAGIQLDHWTGSQWHVGKRIDRMADVLPGDLLFFAYDTTDESTIHHVAIYIGKGKMIEAPYTGEVVRVSSAYRPDFIGATRPWSP